MWVVSGCFLFGLVVYVYGGGWFLDCVCVLCLLLGGVKWLRCLSWLIVLFSLDSIKLNLNWLVLLLCCAAGVV